MANFKHGQLVDVVRSIVASGSFTQLTKNSQKDIIVTGSQSHAVRLPPADQLDVLNLKYTVKNRTTAKIEVQNSTGVVLSVLKPLTETTFALTNNSTAAGVWDFSEPSASVQTVRVKLLDTVSVTLPTGPSAIIDGVAVSNGDLVLFTELSSGSGIYEVSGVGGAIAWTPAEVFQGGFSSIPEDGDEAYITSGDTGAKNFLFFDGTEWKNLLNTKVYNPLLNNSTDVNLVVMDKNQVNKLSMEYAIERNSGEVEVGMFFACHDGGVANYSKSAAAAGDTGCTLMAKVVGSYFILSYSTTNTGTHGILSRTIKVW